MSRKGIGYAAARPYAVADSLAELHGPTSGEVRLPHRLDWGPPYTYALADAGEVAVMYETVIREARDPADLAAFLDAETLRTLWPSLFLPAPARALWEARFPELRQAAAA
ncbi:hypothetical protein [Streptomyces sp. 3N207]|uniref:hypothetical protein n=1 Tax=Streptomyces sp. 3N207 TaxID=3457417 RepID=UPI003FD63C19